MLVCFSQTYCICMNFHFKFVFIWLERICYRTRQWLLHGWAEPGGPVAEAAGTTSSEVCDVYGIVGFNVPLDTL